MTAELKDVAPIPPEINKYLAILSKDPGSMVFAPLAEGYRKVGMLDEAIATAQDGLKLHPNYVSGMVALGRAYFEKGLHVEARETLEKVLAIAPDNIIAVNILKEIKSQWTVAGNQGKEKPEPTASDQEAGQAQESQSESAFLGSPEEDEVEELDELEELAELVGEEAEEEPEDFPVEEMSFEAPESGLVPAIEVKEEVKVVEAFVNWGDEAATELEEEPGVNELFKPEATVGKQEVEERETRPRKEITTGTIADLYIKQGYFDKAIDIYQTLYDADPENDEIKNKLEELKKQVKTKEQEEIKEEIIEEKLVGAGLKPALTEEAIDKDSENITRLESWLETIQSERRRG